ncbi:STAS domain-containing protein [Micromonospora sp. NBS 11-29]|uniref:STAS domain-containing protein n=1 Tax=Micromonospora sp. NBS 11-29 TaxID=1960879 RepID=UPI000B7815F6|nr:STAS domain-containing protein [Micromonospora sp. NBS 11-29]
MTLHIDTTTEDGAVTIVLAGEADSRSAPALYDTIRRLDTATVTRLVLDVERLTYLSSAGLRCLVYAHQQLGRGVRIVITGATAEVAETIRLTGFDHSVTMVGGAGT